MAEEGAKSVVLLSRRGVVGAGTEALCCDATGEELQAMWQPLQDFALEFQVKACDVASLTDVQEMAMSLDSSFTVRPLAFKTEILKGKSHVGSPARGLIHLAAVLDDATLPKLTRRHLEKAYGAKVRPKTISLFIIYL